MFSIKMDLSKESERMLKLLPEKFKKGLNKGVKNAMFFVEDKAKQRVTVRTGHLRRSLKVDVREESGGVAGRVGSDVVYAAIQEFGGVAGQGAIIKKQEYITKSIKENDLKIRDLITKAIDEETK